LGIHTFYDGERYQAIPADDYASSIIPSTAFFPLVSQLTASLLARPRRSVCPHRRHRHRDPTFVTGVTKEW
jgi:hypothetical protein